MTATSGTPDPTPPPPIPTQPSGMLAVTDEFLAQAQRVEPLPRCPRQLTDDEYAALYAAAIACERVPNSPAYLAALVRAIAERLYAHRGPTPCAAHAGAVGPGPLLISADALARLSASRL